MPRTMNRLLLPLLALAAALAPARALAQTSPPPAVLAPGTAVYGDVNRDGRVSALDAVAVLGYVVGTGTPAGYQMLPNADANGDGAVTAMDALVIAGAAMGRDMSRYPVGQDVDAAILQGDGTSRATAPAGSTLTLLAGDGQTGFAGDSLKRAVQVVLKNSGGSPVPSVVVTWTVLTGGGALRAATSKTGATGISTNRWLLGAAGPQTIRASIVGVGEVDFSATSVDPTTATITIQAGDAQAAPAGDTLPRVVSVVVKDASNNVVPGVGISWAVLSGGGSVPAAVTYTSPTGIAASRWVLGSTAGPQTLQAGIPGGASVTFTAAAAPTTGMSVTKLTDNLYGIAGDSLGLGGWVQVLDSLGAPTAATVNWAAQDGGAVRFARSTTNAAGRASSRWLLGPGVGTQHLTASVDGGPTVTFSTTALPVDSVVLTLNGDGQRAEGGTALSVSVDVTDGHANPVSGYVAYAPLTGGSPTAAGRVVTFSQVPGAVNPGRAPMTWTLGSARGYQTFQASVASGQKTATFTALSTLLAGDSLTQVAGSTSGTAGAAVGTAPSVRVTTDAGVAVEGYPVVFRVTAGGGSIDGAATGDSVIVNSDASGIASLSSWTLGAVGTNTVNATAGARSLDISATADEVLPTLGENGIIQQIDCTATTGGSGTLTCSSGQTVLFTTSNVAAFGGELHFDATVQNLITEAIGTPDGVTPDTAAINVFLFSGPRVTGGTGTVSLASADGTKQFTSPGQPFVRYYDGVLEKDEVSSTKTWAFAYDPGVASFTFRMFVQAELQPFLVINEMLVNPGGLISDANGEWVELYNRGHFAVQMKGLVIADSAASGRRAYHEIASPLTVQPGGYVTLGNTTNTTNNGGVPIDYAYGAAMGFANSLDAFKIARVYGTDTLTLDRTQYASAATSAQNGISRELKNPALDNSNMDGSNWTDASVTSVYGPGGRGTPKAQSSGFVAWTDTQPRSPFSPVLTRLAWDRLLPMKPGDPAVEPASTL
jgi:hypothetical protein